jgi:hypothetical protein
MIVKTTTHICSTLKHQIMEWAINAELFEDVANEEVPGWSSWDRTGVLTSKRLIIDWDTPHIASYSKLILQRLRGLHEDRTDDIYAQAAKGLEDRIRRVNEQLLVTYTAKKLRQKQRTHKRPFRPASQMGAPCSLCSKERDMNAVSF